ncbi:MAG: rhomboid family intramembrane serine protease [Desulfarculus sp.]|nr:rhomboid family intramembrane serine protease [Desulfarculus sp.]
MIPLKSDLPLLGRPHATLGLIALNVAVYLYQFPLSPPAEHLFFMDYGLVPGWLTSLGRPGPPPGFLPRPLTLVSAMFLHGGLLHLLGNMLYLWIFGPALEDTLGRARYLAFYLLGGMLASLVFVLGDPSSMLPMIGASGAVAAVLGAYLVLFPRARVLVLFWFFFLVQTARVPALFLLAIWFLWQVLGLGGPGVAWMAHIGGFVAGLLMVRLFLPRRPRWYGR